jgi:hypothetical protein
MPLEMRTRHGTLGNNKVGEDGDVTKWLSLKEGQAATGLRIAPVRGVPSPWSELCRALFHVKHIPFALINARDPELGLLELKAATAQESLPVVFWNSERPRAGWLEQLSLAERLADGPKLLPESPRERAFVIGFLSELCAEDGFGWHRRLLLIDRMLTESGYGERERAIGRYLGDKYGFTSASLPESRRRCESIVAAFAALNITAEGFFARESLSALDLGWTAFTALIQPLPHDLCPMDTLWRDLYTWTPSESAPDAIAALLAHRDRIYRDWLELPVILR